MTIVAAPVRAWVVANLALAVAACAGPPGQKALYPVKGRVLYEGQPAVNALVVFHPLNNPDPQAMRPYARVQEDGSFTPISYGERDGAPAGEYAVTIEWTGKSPDEEEASAARDILKGRYRDPKTTKLKVTIQAGPNELKPFQLKK